MSETRTALVTGASAGLGAAIARAFGALGWRVALGARRVDRLLAVRTEVERAGGTAFAHELDVADPGSIERFFTASEDAHGVADVVVNNAGGDRPGRLHELDPARIAHDVATNLLGPMLVSRRALAPLLAAGTDGDLVFVTSDAARVPRPQQSIYTATKAGVEGLANALALELEGTAVRCTSLRLGPAYSEFAVAWGEDRIGELIGYWQHYGLQRHTAAMSADSVARSVVQVVTLPRGAFVHTLELQPEAPRAGD